MGITLYDEALRALQAENVRLRKFQTTMEALQVENMRLRTAHALLLEGTPGAVKEAPSGPEVPAWGTPSPVATVLPVTAPDERYVRRLERERDEMRKQLQRFGRLAGGSAEALMDYIDRVERDLERYKRQAASAEGVAKRATETMKRYSVEIERLSREVGRMRTDGVLPAARLTDNDPTVTLLEERWKRKWSLKYPEIQTKESKYDSVSHEIINIITYDGGSEDVFFRFTLQHDLDAEEVAGEIMNRIGAQRRISPVHLTLHEDVAMHTQGSPYIIYTFRFHGAPS